MWPGYYIFPAFSYLAVAMHGHQGFLKCHDAHVTIILFLIPPSVIII